jgi:hypothetical protein
MVSSAANTLTTRFLLKQVGQDSEFIVKSAIRRRVLHSKMCFGRNDNVRRSVWIAGDYKLVL